MTLSAATRGVLLAGLLAMPAWAEDPAPADAQTVDVAVRVSDLDAKAVRGAVVVAADGAKQVAAATADESGLATLARLPRRDVRLVVTAEGWFAAAGTLHAADSKPKYGGPGGPMAFANEWTPESDEPGAAPTVAIALVRVVDVTVQGAREGDRVVARAVAAPLQISKSHGAVVTFVGQGAEGLVASFEEIAGKDGECTFRGVPSHATLVARIERPGSSCRAVAVEVHEERPVVLLLAPTTAAWTLAGRVADAAGNPVAGARVYVAPADAPLALARPDNPPESQARDESDVPLAWTVTCDAEGAYSVPFLERGKTYAARAESGGTLASPVTWDLEAPPDKPSDDARVTADFVVAPLLTIDGTVEDADGARPERGFVRLDALPRDDGVERTAAIEKGAFRFPGLLPGRYAMSLEGRGFRAMRRELLVGPSHPGSIAVRVDAGAVITGSVVDLDGKGVEGVRVQAFDPDVEAVQVIRYPIGAQGCETKADGSFRLAGLAPGTWNLRAVAEGEGLCAPLVEVEAPTKDVTIRVGPPPKLRFGIKLPAGVTMNEVRLGVFRLVGDGVPYRAGDWDHDELGPTTAAFKDLPADEDVLVRFVVPGHPPYMRRFRLAPGETRDLGVLDPPEGLAVEGVVRSTEGAPVPGVKVSAELYEGRPVKTDEEGRFRLENVAAGEQEIRLWCFSTSFVGTAEVNVTIPSKEPLDLRIRRHPAVRGRVATESGKPAGRRVVFHAVRPWGKLRRPQTVDLAEDGAFEIQLEPGRYRVTVHGGASDAPLAPTRIVVVPEEPPGPLELSVPDR